MDKEEMSDEVVYDRGYSRIVIRRYKDKNGNDAEWGMVHMNTHGKNAVVAALTEENELILERSYRVPLLGEVIELPGGMNDQDGGETPEEIARRELLEETGYEIGELTRVATLADSPGITDQETVLYVGRGAKKVREPALGASEEIAVLLVPLHEAKARLREETCPIDARVLAALAFL